MPRPKSDYQRYEAAAEWSRQTAYVSEIARNFRVCGFTTELDLTDGGLVMTRPHYKEGQEYFFSIDLPGHVTLVQRTFSVDEFGTEQAHYFNEETATLENACDALHVFAARQQEQGFAVVTMNESQITTANRDTGLIATLTIKEFYSEGDQR